MKLKKFEKKNPVHIGMIIASTVLVILTAVLIIYKSFALYEQKNSFEIVNGRVPDQNYDAMLSFYIDDGNGNQTFVESMPTENGHDYGVNVSCDNGATGEWDYIKWGPLITNITSSRTKCKLIFGARTTDTLNIGDYVYYKPTKTSYTTSASYVGGSSYVTTINPSELTMWRVIKKNEDGSIEVVSENVSSTDVTFYGTTGYKNLVGQLNLIAKQYEDERYTVGSRHMGYSNQEEFITTITSSNRSDTGYVSDINLVSEALGTLVANKVATTAATGYWLASRSYVSNHVNYGNIYYGGCVSNSGNFGGAFLYSNVSGDGPISISARPILILKSGLVVEGDGTSETPFRVND